MISNEMDPRPKGGYEMKEKTAPKKTWLQTLRALWVPLAIGIVTGAAESSRSAYSSSRTRMLSAVLCTTSSICRVWLVIRAVR